MSVISCIDVKGGNAPFLVAVSMVLMPFLGCLIYATIYISRIRTVFEVPSLFHI